jgi:hypothetical protein
MLRTQPPKSGSFEFLRKNTPWVFRREYCPTLWLKKKAKTTTRTRHIFPKKTLEGKSRAEKWSEIALRLLCPLESVCATKISEVARVVYRFGIFGRYSVGISPVLPIPYRRKTRPAHFGIKKGAVPPLFLKRGAMAPFLRSSNPF